MRPESFFRLRERPCCGVCHACDGDLERKAKELADKLSSFSMRGVDQT